VRPVNVEGARALIASAFERLHLDRVVAIAMAGNIGSWQVLENCGMRRVRAFCYLGADLMPGAEHGDFAYEPTVATGAGRASTSHQSMGRAESAETHPATSAAWITGAEGPGSTAAGPAKTSSAALSMITKEKSPMRVLFFRDHEISGLRRPPRPRR
jgi:hypothetical protein